MNYLYEAIQPTRLYVKQCSHCDLKYFGKTMANDIEKYPGSGIRWSRHLKKHNAKSIHLWCSDWYYDTSISIFAINFSRTNNIVDDKKWANLKEENGFDGGWDYINSSNTIRKQIHETKVSRYGDDYMMLLVSDSVTQKREATCMEKYGARNTLLVKDFRDKQKETLLENYGVDVPYKSEEIRNRGKDTMIKRYGVENPAQIPHVREKQKSLWKIRNENPEKYKIRYVNNGSHNKKIHYNDSLPEGFVEGRLPNNKFSITDGKTTITVKNISEIPEGWYIGNSNKANKMIINNGIEERRIIKGQEIPTGFNVGGISRKFYTNGKITLRLKCDDPIPDGFFPGRKL